MDGTTFDRFVKALAGSVPRRAAVKALAGGGLAAAGATAGVHELDAKNKKKKRCRKPGQTCGGQKKCCKDKGATVCQDFSSSLCLGVTLSGNRCCGLEGTICDPGFGTPVEIDPINAVGNCSCCDPLFCGKQLDGKFRCQVEVT